MTTFHQFARRARMRHDFSDQIQVRYSHANGEEFDTWISGEEVLARLKTASREELIKSFSQMNLAQAKRGVKKEIEERKKQFRSDVMDRLGGLVEDNIGATFLAIRWRTMCVAVTASATNMRRKSSSGRTTWAMKPSAWLRCNWPGSTSAIHCPMNRVRSQGIGCE